MNPIAKEAENKGHFEDAAMLYDIADVGFESLFQFSICNCFVNNCICFHKKYEISKF